MNKSLDLDGDSTRKEEENQDTKEDDKETDGDSTSEEEEDDEEADSDSTYEEEDDQETDSDSSSKEEDDEETDGDSTTPTDEETKIMIKQVNAMLQQQKTKIDAGQPRRSRRLAGLDAEIPEIKDILQFERELRKQNSI